MEKPTQWPYLCFVVIRWTDDVDLVVLHEIRLGPAFVNINDVVSVVNSESAKNEENVKLISVGY